MVSFTKEADKQFNRSNPKSQEKINQLLDKVVKKTPDLKPKVLIGDLTGYYSLKINRKDRLVYQVIDDNITVVSCKGHYKD